MLSIRDLPKEDLAELYEQVADFVETVSQFTPTTSVTGLVHHGQNLMQVIEDRLAYLDPLPRKSTRRAALNAQPVEVK